MLSRPPGTEQERLRDLGDTSSVIYLKLCYRCYCLAAQVEVQYRIDVVYPQVVDEDRTSLPDK